MQRADGHKRFLRFEIFEDTAPLARRGKLPLILYIPELLHHLKTIIKDMPCHAIRLPLVLEKS